MKPNTNGVRGKYVFFIALPLLVFVIASFAVWAFMASGNTSKKLEADLSAYHKAEVKIKQRGGDTDMIWVNGEQLPRTCKIDGQGLFDKNPARIICPAGTRVEL